MHRCYFLVALVLVTTSSLLAQGRAPAQPATQATAAQATAAQAAPAASASLPVRRVVLYKTGVGYFEHLGNVRNRQDVAIRFTSAQLNDVLKSLTTIDMGEGQVTGISYNSIAPMEQRLGALRIPLGPGATTIDLLSAIRGARIEVTGPSGAVGGRLLSVERQNRSKDGEVVIDDVISLVTDGGDVRSFTLTPALHVRIVDGDLRQEVSRYLDVVGSSREQDVRQMVISTSGAGERPLFVSYVSEVPIWKTTYRLVLRDKDSKAKPLLQGWAIIDNTIGEDWKGVELSLVAGAPQSFIQDISQPYYGRRPTVPLPQSVLLMPQTHMGTLTSKEGASVEAVPVGDPSTTTRDNVIARELREREVRSGLGGGVPSGRIGGVVGGLPSGPPPPAASPAPPRAYEQMANQAVGASAAPLGDLFEYRIKEPVSLRKNQSALVPIVSAEISAEKVALWNRAPGSGRPLRAVWLTNGSGLTLDGGSISVIDGNAFAGEGLIASLKPGERRLLSYAADIGVLVDSKSDATPGRLVRIRARDGIVIQETEERASWTYTARSEEASPVTLIIEHRQRAGWKLTGDPTPVETTPDAYRFRVMIDPKKEATLTVREARTGETRVSVSDFLDSLNSQLVVSGAGSDALQRALAPLLAKRSEVATIERQLASLEADLRSIVEDQQRLRENMKALRGSAEEKQLLQRYTRQLDEQENKLEALRRQIATTTSRRDAARGELNALIGSFSYEG
jgi:hypothetical protein